MNIKQIKQLLGKIPVSNGKTYYNGSGYRKDYQITSTPLIESRTSYMKIPVMTHSAGFITTEKGELCNFYWHDGEGFQTTKDIDLFITKVN